METILQAVDSDSDEDGSDEEVVNQDPNIHEDDKHDPDIDNGDYVFKA